MWHMNMTEGTATGTSRPVTVDGALLAVLTPLWDDEAGVRVSVDWQSGDALSANEARAFAVALVEAVAVGAPR